MSKVTVVSRPNRITIASKGVQGAVGPEGARGPEGPQGIKGDTGDVTPEAIAARDAAQLAATTAEGARDEALPAAAAAVAARDAAQGYSTASAASAALAEQARLLGATVGFATKAAMDGSLAHADGVLALVTNDATPANNGTYRKTGASGAGAWVKSADRVTGLEVRVGGAEDTINEVTSVSPNLFDARTILPDHNVGPLGVPAPAVGWYMSDYIPVEPSTQYTFSQAAIVAQFAFFTSAKAYIAPISANASTFMTPATAAYVRIAHRYSNHQPEDFMLVKGSSLPSEYRWYRGLGYPRLEQRNAPGGYAGLGSDGKLAGGQIPFYNSRNLFDATKITNGVYITDTGATVSDVGFFTTDFIPVVPGAPYRWSTTGPQKYATFYDEGKGFISGAFHTGAASPPPGAAFMRVSPRHSETPPGDFMLVQGTDLPPEYQPYAGLAVESQINKNVPGGYVGLGDDGKVPAEVLPPTSFPLAGKTIAGLGDSITYGFIPRNAAGYPGQLNSWLVLAAARLGAGTLNYGLSGSTLGANSSGADQPMSRRFGAMSDSADLVTVMGGTNDVRKGVPLGVMGDTTDTTYFGALDVLCQGLLNKYRYVQGTTSGAGKKIMFMTPIRLLDTAQPDGLQATLPAYCEAMKQVCAKYGIPVFDAYNLSGLTPELFRTVQGTEAGYTDLYNPYVTDGTHPTQEGHRIFADAVAGFIRTLY